MQALENIMDDGYSSRQTAHWQEAGASDAGEPSNSASIQPPSESVTSLQRLISNRANSIASSAEFQQAIAKAIECSGSPNMRPPN